MSHSPGLLKFQDGIIRFYEYDGTGDTVISNHFATDDDLDWNWRTWRQNQCNCGCEEEVRLYTSYGYGFFFDGMACRYCNSVRALFDEDDCFLNEIMAKDVKIEERWDEQFEAAYYGTLEKVKQIGIEVGFTLSDCQED